MERITSAKNPLIQSLRALREGRARRETGCILVEGEVMLREALSCGLKPRALLVADGHEGIEGLFETSGARCCSVPEALLAAVCDTKTQQGVCASFEAPRPLALKELPERLIVLDGVQDPGNVGTIWRTADAAGFQALIAGAGTADLMSPKVLRAAMGSGFRLPYVETHNLPDLLDALAESGYTIIVSDLRGDSFYARPKAGKRVALLVGNEARGVSEASRERATMRVKLPMRGGAESLNAAVAAGILMYELMREIEEEQ
ncbi:MAG: RNA methyltransferase [Clostridia bacterium]|nr:RNA methyltransferase [Clostridia bacterium]